MESFMDELKIESIVGTGTKITMKKLINADSNNSVKRETTKM